MKESKLAEILSSFSKEEIKSFEKFIVSPYFSTRKDLSSLLSLLKKHHPGFDSSGIEKEKIFSALYPSEVYNEKKLKNLTSDLTKLAEQFLVIGSIKDNDIEYQRMLAELYRDREKERLFLNTVNSLEKKIGDELFDGRECFRNEEEFLKLKDNYLFRNNDIEGSIKARLKYVEYFTLTFLVKYLKQLRDQVVVNTRYNTPFENQLFDSFTESIDFEKMLNSLKEKNYSFLWLIEIYYYAYMCSYRMDEGYYQKFKNLFYENIARFTRFEKHYIFVSLAFYSIRKGEMHHPEAQKEEFEVYKEMLKHEAYSYSELEPFNVVFFRNIVFIALKHKEYEWLENFSEEYTGKLKQEYRENVSTLVKANLYFVKKDFERALENISRIKYDFFLFKLDVKNLMLQIYYELNLFDQAFSMVDAYRHFLENNKEHASVHNRQIRNFLDIYNKLLKAKDSGKTEDIGMLLKKLDSSGATACRTWLIEKIGEMEK